MRKHSPEFVLVLAAVLCLATGGAPAWSQPRQEARESQAAVTQDDIQRLEDTVHDVNRSIDQLRNSDPDRAARLQQRLDALRDEVTYLKVRLRKEGTISSDELADTRGRLEELRAQALGEAPAPYDARPRGTIGVDRDTRPDRDYPERGEPARQSLEARPNEVPAGTELDIRLQTPLSSETSQVEDRFEATTLVDLMSGDRVLVPAGTSVRGVVSSVNKAGRIERKGRLTLRLDEMSIAHRSYPIRASVTEAIESSGYKGDAVKIGAGAGVGAIIGGILGGEKGALAGLLIGGGGVVAATEGQDVDLPAGAILRIRFDEPVVVR